MIIFTCLLASLQAVLASHNPSSTGTEFAFVFPRQVLGGTNGWNRVQVSTYSAAAQIYISAPLQSYTANHSLAAFSTWYVDVPLYFRIGWGVEQLGLFLTSSQPVNVWVFNSLSAFSSDAALVTPSTHLGTEYIVSSYTPYQSLFINQYTSSTLTVLPMTASTSVILYRYDASAGGWVIVSTYQTNLKGETVTINSTSTDYTGYKIVTSAASAVFSGSDCAVAPQSGQISTQFISNGCDMIMEQLVPISGWGTTYLAFPDPTGSRKHSVRVMSDRDVSVTLAVAGRTYSAAPGSFAEFEVTSSQAEQVTCNVTCQVTSLMQYSFSTVGFGTDSYMINLVPTAYFGHEYMVDLFRGGSWITGEYAIIFISTADITGLVVNSGGVSVSGWSAIGSTSYSYTKLRLSSSTAPYQFAHINSNVRFGVYITAQSIFEGYCYSAGFMRDPIITTVAPNITTTTAAPETALAGWVYGLIVVVLVVVVAVVAVCVFCMIKKSKDSRVGYTENSPAVSEVSDNTLEITRELSQDEKLHMFVSDPSTFLHKPVNIKASTVFKPKTIMKVKDVAFFDDEPIKRPPSMMKSRQNSSSDLQRTETPDTAVSRKPREAVDKSIAKEQKAERSDRQSDNAEAANKHY